MATSSNSPPSAAAGAAAVSMEPDHVMNYRGGSVLGKKTILKSDHFPGCQNKRLTPQIDGAPNYRQAGSLHVHGVAIPTIDGIRNVLNHIGAKKNGKQKKVLWHNLREEPVVYINGCPFVLRDVERPFSNLEYTGINRDRVEQMEFRLKEDILLESTRYGNKILVTDELPDGQMVDQWEPVMHDSVKTPLEVYEELQEEGYLVDYERVPITDEKSPKEGDFDDLLVHHVDHFAEVIREVRRLSKKAEEKAAHANRRMDDAQLSRLKAEDETRSLRERVKLLESELTKAEARVLGEREVGKARAEAVRVEAVQAFRASEEFRNIKANFASLSYLQGGIDLKEKIRRIFLDLNLDLLESDDEEAEGAEDREIQMEDVFSLVHDDLAAEDVVLVPPPAVIDLLDQAVVSESGAPDGA